jgi:hypothetical protein
VNQADLLHQAVGTLESLQIPYMLVGSFASVAYGEPRLARDIDILVDLPIDKIDALCEAFPSGDFRIGRNAIQTSSQFSVIHPATGNVIDFILRRRDKWGATQLARRRSLRVLPDLSVSTAAPEDVILGKLVYYREGGFETHLRDIAAMLQVSGEIIDNAYISEWAKELHLTEVWEAVLTRLRERP